MFTLAPRARTVAACLLISFLTGHFVSMDAVAYEGEIDFAYSGGAYMMDRTGHEETVITRFIQALLKAGDFQKDKICVVQYEEERELHGMMREERVIVAAVTREFFDAHGKGLELEPLVVPMIDGKTHMVYLVLTRSENRAIQSTQDLWGKRLAVLRYEDQWYQNLLGMLGMPEVILMDKLPENRSVVTALIHGHADAALIPEHVLKDLLASTPHLMSRIRILARTPPLPIAPLVTQKGRLAQGEKARMAFLLETASTREDLRSILKTMGFSGFTPLTREDLLKR